METGKLKQKLFSNRTKTYCVLDGAGIEGLPKALFDHDPLNECLIRGELGPDMIHVAPYVAFLLEHDKFTDWVFEHALGKNAVIFINTRFSIVEMRNHLRSLITVHDEDGKPMLFRYYDPRVFRKFLPTCDEEQLTAFFGKIDTFFVESEDGTELVAYRLENGTLEAEGAGSGEEN